MVQRTSGTRTKVTSANAVTSTEKKLTDFPLLARIPVACTFYWTYAYARYKIKLIVWYTRKLLTKTPYELGEELYLKKPKKLVRTWIDKQEFFVLNWGKIPRGMIRVAYIPLNQTIVDPHLVDNFPLESDGSFDMRRVTRKWNLQHAYAIDVREWRVYYPEDGARWKLSPSAIHSLTRAIGSYTLRVIENPEPRLIKARNMRLSILEEIRHRRWQLQVLWSNALHSPWEGGAVIAALIFLFLVLIIGFCLFVWVFFWLYSGVEEIYTDACMGPYHILSGP